MCNYYRFHFCHPLCNVLNPRVPDGVPGSKEKLKEEGQVIHKFSVTGEKMHIHEVILYTESVEKENI